MLRPWVETAVHDPLVLLIGGGAVIVVALTLTVWAVAGYRERRRHRRRTWRLDHPDWRERQS